jgi:magnesium chelatase family protein
MAKISGPLLDRIDIHIEVPAVAYRELKSARPGTTSAEMRQAVVAAREIQARRFHRTQARTNARMTPRQVRQYCELDHEGEELMKTAMSELGLSARAHDKVLRVARTVADLEASSTIRAHHLSEAINYRLLDRKLW